MRTQLDRDVRVVVQHLDHLIQRLFRFWSQSGFVKIIEDILDDHRFADGREEEIDDIGLVLLLRAGVQLIILIEVASGTRHHHITNIPLQFYPIGAILLDRYLHVQAIFTNDAHGGLLDRVFVHVVDYALYGNRNRRQLKRIEVVITSSIVAVGAKETFFCLSSEGDAKIIAHGIDGSSHILHFPMAGTVLGGFK